MPPSGERQAELVTSLGALRARVSEACSAAGRDPREITLIAVTKTYPAADVATLAQLGVLDVGESKDQEARGKLAELAHAVPAEHGENGEHGAAEVRAPAALRWHLVGRLQTNKARSVAGYAHAVHSVDRTKLARALGAATAEQARVLDAFVQVSLDGDPGRGGVGVDALDELVDTVAEQPGLRLAGLMAVAPLGSDPDAQFGRLAELSARLCTTHPGADLISAGMSGDLEAALRHGATHLRVGSALLGRRDPTFG